MERFEPGKARVGVIGLGYVGLPLLYSFHRAGFDVAGFDVDPGKITALSEGRSYIGAVTDEQVGSMVDSGRFEATDEFKQLRQMNAILICVPTPLTSSREPDLSYVQSTAQVISRYLERGQLIVLESTTYPGTTDEIVRPILEESGLEAGRDFYLAFSPEREDPGNQKFNTRNIPKLIGGLDPTSGELASSLYSQAVEEVILLSHANVAEAAKILENIYRAVNIALVNELKLLFDRMDIDVWEVIEAAKTKPFGFQAFYPGPGLGGHCIPIDPFYLTWKARQYDLSTRFIELAGEINHSMPSFVVHKVGLALDSVKKSINGSRGLVLGVAYKPDTDDVRESPAFKIIEILQGRGATLAYHDPYVPKLPRTREYDLSLEYVELEPAVLASFDFALIVTDHSGVDWASVVEHSQLVVDTRNATRDIGGDRSKIFPA